MLASTIPTPTDVRGNVQLRATAKGAPYDLRAEAQIDLQEIVLKSGMFSGGPPAGGGMMFETDKTEARLATQMVKADPPRVHIDVRAQRLVFHQQRPHTSIPHHTPAPTATIPPGPTPQTAPSQPMLPPVTLSGQVSIAEGRIQHLNFQQMTADLSLIEGLLKTTQQMQLYGGSYQGATQVDLTQSEPSYTLDARVAGLHVGPALDDLTPARKMLLGVLDTDMRLSGRGFAWDVIQKTLSGNGHVKVTEAQLTTFDLLPKLGHLLREVGGLVGLTLSDAWERQAFRTIEGDWHLQQGKILTDHLRLRGEGVEALLKGYVGLDRSIEYTGNVFVPAQFIARQGVPTLLRQDEDGRVAIPFTVKGTVTEPHIAVSEKVLVDLAKEELTDTVRKQLGDKLEGLFGKPSASDQPSQQSDKPREETETPPKRQDLPGKILRELLRR